MVSTPITPLLIAPDRDASRLAAIAWRTCAAGALTVVAACSVVIGIAELLASSGRALGWTLLVAGCLELAAALPLLVGSVLTLGARSGPRRAEHVRQHRHLLVR